jgi:hypothetical protein
MYIHVIVEILKFGGFHGLTGVVAVLAKEHEWFAISTCMADSMELPWKLYTNIFNF